jgi:2-polyprenyl-6-methoxyphenol hydroxylase-like FAD-dependent oxidoreductase
MSAERPRVVVLGAGLVGCLAALSLQRMGFSVTIYERYKDFRSIPSLGRSINLVLTGRGLRAVAQVGRDVLSEVVAMATPVTCRILHNTYTSERLEQRYGKDDSEFNLSISRFELNKYLITKATAKGASVVFDYNLTAVDATSGDWLRLTFQTPQGKVELDTGCPVIAADGGGSRVRYQLRDAGLTSFTEEQCVQGCVAGGCVGAVSACHSFSCCFSHRFCAVLRKRARCVRGADKGALFFFFRPPLPQSPARKPGYIESRFRGYTGDMHVGW